MVRFDVHSLKDMLEGFPVPAVLRAGGHWMANKPAYELAASSSAGAAEFQSFEQWLSQIRPNREESLLQLMDGLSRNELYSIEVPFTTSTGEQRRLDIRFLPWQGADMWLLSNQTVRQGELEQLRDTIATLEYQLERRLEDLSRSLNLLLATRQALKKERTLLCQIAEKLQVPIHKLEEWCKNAE